MYIQLYKCGVYVSTSIQVWGVCIYMYTSVGCLYLQVYKCGGECIYMYTSMWFVYVHTSIQVSSESPGYHVPATFAVSALFQVKLFSLLLTINHWSQVSLFIYKKIKLRKITRKQILNGIMVQNVNNIIGFSTIIIVSIICVLAMIYIFGSIELNKKTEAEEDLEAHMIRSGTFQVIVNIIVQTACFTFPVPSTYALR